MGLEPDRLVALVSGRRGSPLIVSASFITYRKMNVSENGSVREWRSMADMRRRQGVK